MLDGQVRSRPLLRAMQDANHLDLAGFLFMNPVHHDEGRTGHHQFAGWVNLNKRQICPTGFQAPVRHEIASCCATHVDMTSLFYENRDYLFILQGNK